jgi:predicted MPP superfamily phosphohydrolase
MKFLFLASNPSRCPPEVLPPLSRRRFLALAGIAAGTLWALPPRGHAYSAVDTYTLDVHEVPVPVRKLPRHLEGLTIAHISDTHLRQLGPLEESVITAVQAKNPAVVVLTGDMLNSRTARPLLAEFCHALTAPGRHVLAIRGNHDVWSRIPVASLKDLYRRAGVHLLVNEHLTVDGALTIVGTEDSVTQHYNLRTALRGLPTTPVRLHLSHAPEVFDWAPAPRVSFALCLAGHTHGGQIRVPFLPPFVPEGAGPRFVAGWYPQTGMGPAYVSRGIGTTGIPLRVNCPPELPFLRLTRA